MNHNCTVDATFLVLTIHLLFPSIYDTKLLTTK